MYIFNVYTYMYVYTCIYICIYHIYVYIYTPIYIPTHMFTYMTIYIFVYVSCIDVCVYIYIYIYMYTHTHAHKICNVNDYTRMRECKSKCENIKINTQLKIGIKTGNWDEIWRQQVYMRCGSTGILI